MSRGNDGFGLACTHCGFVFPLGITQGVMAAHFETEHGVTKVDLNLVVLCPRCDGVMVFEYEPRPGREQYYCDPCRRTRVITRGTTGRELP